MLNKLMRQDMIIYSIPEWGKKKKKKKRETVNIRDYDGPPIVENLRF